MQDITVTDVRCNKGDSAFLIDDGKTAVLYDTGFGFTGFAVADNIKKVLGERQLDYIFLTHSHYDHALGSAYILRRYPDAKVVAGSYAADIFKRDGAKAMMRQLDGTFAAECGVTDYEFLGNELRVDIRCNDGDIVTAGDMSFRVLELPGHTKCSVAFYCEERALLLSCETLGVYDGKELILPSCLVGYKACLEAIDRISGLKIERLLAPHLGILDKKQTEFFLHNARSSTESAARFILDRIGQGMSDEDIISDVVREYRRGYIEEIYPVPAMELNTSIMIKLLKKEVLCQEV